jgi:hypothetical protein
MSKLPFDSVLFLCVANSALEGLAASRVPKGTAVP